MNTYQEMVREFHRKFGSTVGETVGLRDEALAASLIAEEAAETVNALERGDLIETVDGLCDLLYVTFGAAIRLGVDLDIFFQEVHRTNMAKEGGATRGDGKILKPEGWQPPRIGHLLFNLGWRA